MGLFVSERTLRRLPDAYREVVRQEAREAAIWQRELIARRNAEALVQMQERFGVQVSGLDSDELRAKGSTVQDQTAATLGLQDLLGRVRNAAKGEGHSEAAAAAARGQ